MKSLGGASRPPKPAPRLWRWCSRTGRGLMIDPCAELCPDCLEPIPPTPAST